MRPRSDPRPPSLARAILRVLTPARAHDEVAGDLHELFLLRMERDGRGAARRWYWRQIARAYFDLEPLRRPVISRSMAGDPLMVTVAQDVRYAVRMLLKQPSFTATAVLMLALGIGANATIFSWVNSVLLNPLPGAERPGELVQLAYTRRGAGMMSSFSYPDFRDLRELAGTLSGITAREDVSVGIAIDQDAEQTWADMVSGDFFDVLGVRAWRGRVLQPADDRPGAPPVLVLGYDYWVSRFAASDAAIGRQVRVNAQPFTIVGVASPGFQGGTSGLQFDVWVPVGTQPVVIGGVNRLEARRHTWLTLIARRAPGQSLESVRAELAAVAEQWQRSYEGYDELSITAVPLSESPTGAVSVLRTVLLVLMVTSAIVLLITCANLAGLLMARAAARQREMAIRLSVGADRFRLVQQLLVEGVLLGAAGLVSALIALRWTSGLLMGFAPPSELPIRLDVAVDLRVVAFTAAVAIGTVLLFALVPAFHATGANLTLGLREGGSSGSTFGRNRLRRGLVAAQVALSITLLIGAGLCVRSLWAAQASTPGFVAEGVVVGWLGLSSASYHPAEGRAFYQRVLDRVRALPGVQSASLSRRIPLGFIGGSSSTITVEGYHPQLGENLAANINRVGSDYFETMRIPLVAGRDIRDGDVAGAPAVAVIGETMARRFWPDGEALGGRFFIGRTADRREPQYITVVGIARDIKHRALNERSQSAVFLSVQQSYQPGMILHVRAAGDPMTLVGELPQVVRALDPAVPFYDIGLLQDHTAAATFQQRLAANLLVVFGGLALLLAAVGAYGVLSYLVGQRRREIGIRLAVGASRASVFRLVVSSGARLVTLGMAAGFVLSIGVGMGLRSLLIGIELTDPVTYGVVFALLTGVAIAACAIPARRAASINPIATLREE